MSAGWREEDRTTTGMPSRPASDLSVLRICRPCRCPASRCPASVAEGASRTRVAEDGSLFRARHARQLTGSNQMPGDLRELDVGVLRCPGKGAEGRVCGESVPLHQDALRLADDVAVGERGTELVGSLGFG